MSDMQKTLDELAAIHDRIQEWRGTLPHDSPLGMAAFRLAAMCGEIEAAVRSAPAERGAPTATRTIDA